VAKLLARRLRQLIITLLVSSFVIFAALYLTPGDPLAFLTGGKPLSPAAIASIKAQYHLNDPFLIRYWDWLTAALHGDLGRSLLFREPVTSLLGPRVAVTLELVAYSSLLILLFGVALGVAAALRPGWLDRSITFTTAIGLAVPSFVAASVLITLFSVQLAWFPVFGAGGSVPDRLWHLTLPAIALALASVAYVSRIARASVREELAGEHVQTARVRGLPKRYVIRHHVVRNAMIPIVTVSGVMIAGLIPGVAVVEQVFGLNGIGAYLITAVNDKDFTVVQGICLLLVVAFVVVNLLVDMLYVLIDPRLAKARA
jgi:peptide/nickel transport system permease protein